MLPPAAPSALARAEIQAGKWSELNGCEVGVRPPEAKGMRTGADAMRVDATALNELSGRILGAGYAVHTALGPGLLESTYEACLEVELRSRSVAVERQKTLPVRYGGVLVDAGYRVDLLVEDLVVIEVKSVRQVAAIHRAQLLTYLKLSACHLGLLLNFNVEHLKLGITRMVNDFPRPEGRSKSRKVNI